MPRHQLTLRWALLLGATVVASACGDVPIPTAPMASSQTATQQAVKFWDDLATTRWNMRATNRLQQYGAPSNGQAWASRLLTYLSLAQYHAVLEATAPENRPGRASVDAAVARASVDVLKNFYATFQPSLLPTLEAELREDEKAARWPGSAKLDVDAGDAIGRAVALEVLALKGDDQYGVVPLPPISTAAGAWVPAAGTPVVRSLYGVTPFFLEPSELLFPVAPPAIGSQALRDAAAEVYAIVNVPSELREEQEKLATKWNRVSPFGPFTAGEWNRTADELIQSHHRTEREAARILAYANVAAFDAQIICFTTKYYWWLPRPWQVDARIFPLVVFTTPNHPSYPSAHSCISGAFSAVLSDAFPSERDMLQALLEEAGLSRIYAGIHYRFDVEVGQQIGAFAAAKALAGSLE
jgi:hypothetical protein